MPGEGPLQGVRGPQGPARDAQAVRASHVFDENVRLREENAHLHNQDAPCACAHRPKAKHLRLQRRGRMSALVVVPLVVVKRKRKRERAPIQCTDSNSGLAPGLLAGSLPQASHAGLSMARTRSARRVVRCRPSAPDAMPKRRRLFLSWVLRSGPASSSLLSPLCCNTLVAQNIVV